MVKIVTAPCILCHAATEVEITDVENAGLISGLFIQDALPDRDAAFREMVKSGIHGDCWNLMFPAEAEEDIYA